MNERAYQFFNILDCMDLEPYGVDPDSFLGLFHRPDIPRLLASEHANLKVISCVGERYYNHEVPNADRYGVSMNDLGPEAEWEAPPLTPELIWDIAESMKGPNATAESLIYADAFERFFGNLLTGRRPLQGVVSDEHRRQVREALDARPLSAAAGLTRKAQ